MGLYVRAQFLVGPTQTGVNSAPVFSASALGSANAYQNFTNIADDVVNLPLLRTYVSSAAILKNIAGGHTHDQTVTQLFHFSVSANTDPAYAQIRDYNSNSNKVPGTARWVLYFSGDAPSYISGNLLLGSTVDNLVDRLQVSGSIQAAQHYKVGSNQVVGARDTGWTAATGAVVANKGAYAPAIIPAAAAAPNKAEFDAAVIALNLANGRIKALEAALRTHGLIN